MNAGDIILLPMPDSTLGPGKLRPVLLLTVLPGRHGDWLLCGVSSQLSEAVADWDELIQPPDPDFGSSGLKVASVVRLNWLATVSPTTAASAHYLGSVHPQRIHRLRRHLADHLSQTLP